MPLNGRRTYLIGIAALAALTVIGGFFRFVDLGARSLWLDEFCTWHVSRIPWSESLRWPPQLNIPPLYQLVLRFSSTDPHPGEVLLRLPAAICGLLLIPVAWRAGTLAAGNTVGLAAAGLVALNGFQIVYSQEARPYTMLALGSALSTLLWYRWITWPRPAFLLGYVLAAAATFHAHYLATLTFAAHATWWLFHSASRWNARSMLRGPCALALVAALCLPMVIHHLRHRSLVIQGLDWIPQPTWRTAFDILGRITFGPIWVFAILLPALAFLAWKTQSAKPIPPATKNKVRQPDTIPRSPQTIGLWTSVLIFNWLGLWLISLLLRPMLIDRYAIAASFPALLLPLIAARSIDRRLPLAILGIVFIVMVPANLLRSAETPPGFRELVAFLEERSDPESDAVIFAIDGPTPPGWENMETVAFDYYPFQHADVHVWPVATTDSSSIPPVVFSPKSLWLITFRADPEPLLQRAGRTSASIEVEGHGFIRLLFEPYRLTFFPPPPAKEP